LQDSFSPAGLIAHKKRLLCPNIDNSSHRSSHTSQACISTDHLACIRNISSIPPASERFKAERLMVEFGLTTPESIRPLESVVTELLAEISRGAF
jgi:hypothetical protein